MYYDLLVMLDIFSRYALGWVVTPAESGQLAEAFIADVIAAHGVAPTAIHADRGTSMTSKPIAQLLADLGVAAATPARTCPTTTRSPRPSSKP